MSSRRGVTTDDSAVIEMRFLSDNPTGKLLQIRKLLSRNGRSSWSRFRFVMYRAGWLVVRSSVVLLVVLVLVLVLVVPPSLGEINRARQNDRGIMFFVARNRPFLVTVSVIRRGFEDRGTSERADSAARRVHTRPTSL